ncbi:MAG: MtnX-like HAD-IB family phosphatase [Ignavibacteriales bacterium]|nr:MtnX-like HAD-IB family phosphatase [Ignavibacteriales bacterium]
MLRAFCDFDGTVASEDIGNQLFLRFAGEETALAIVQRYLDGEITARQCLQQECEAVESLTREEFEKFIDQFTLDSRFLSFFEFCRSKEIPITILSDGLDAYVGRVLVNHGLSELQFFANHVEFVREGATTKLVPSFPYTDSECEKCGNCKRNHMLTLSRDDDILVYVGDGISDRCPVKYADIVFAKKSLIKYCQQQNISYFEFHHFGDVQQRLEGILQKKRIKKRREAMMARREVFMQG